MAFATDDDYPDPEAPPRTSLDPLETSGNDIPADVRAIPPEAFATPPDRLPEQPTLAESFRHSGWQATRRHVYNALQATGMPKSRINDFALCGKHALVMQDTADPSNVRLVATTCKDRFCKPCGSTRSRIIAANVAERIDPKTTRFVTLTLRSGSEPLAQLLEKLYASFKKLRRSPCWRRTQQGGVSFLEIKYNHEANRWHPHLHVLTQGSFISHDELRKEWKAITIDSFIVDVRAIDRVENAVRYVTKYASKPFDPSLFRNESQLEEAILALRSRRTVLTFGNWKGLQTTEPPSLESWKTLGTLADLFQLALAHDEATIKILRALLGYAYDQLYELATQTLEPFTPPPEEPPTVAQLRLCLTA